MRLNFKEVKSFILHLSRLYKVKTILHKVPEWEYLSFGDVDVHDRTINLYPTPKGPHSDAYGYYNLDQLLSTFFHELAHIYCFENGIYGKFYKYHDARLTAKYAYRAELATDAYGEKLMNCFIKGVKYHAYYRTHKKEALDMLSQTYR